MVLRIGYEKYQDYINEERRHDDIEHWDTVTGLLKLAAHKLDRFWFYLPRTHSTVAVGKLRLEALILFRLLNTLQATIINLLKGGVSFSAPVWRAIDENLSDSARRCNDLASTMRRLVSGAGENEGRST